MKISLTFCRNLLALLLLSVSAYAHADDPHITPAPPEFYARSFLLMDYDSGQVLAQYKMHRVLPINALTQAMTSYVVGQKVKNGSVNWNDPVTISRQAWSVNFPNSNKMFIRVANKVPLKDLNLGVIVDSANDASVALAQYISGDQASFVKLMNDWAQTLGMKDTLLTSVNGLTNKPQSHTTAYDMALLARATIHNLPEQFANCAQKQFTWDHIRQYNRNGLLWDQALNVDGLKEGESTDGWNLISTATEGNMRLIAIVMGAPDRYSVKDDSKKLLRYGFSVYNTIEPYAKNTVVESDKVWMGNKNTLPLSTTENNYVTVPVAQLNDLKANVVLNKALVAPIYKGEVVGEIQYSVGDKIEAKYPLIATESVQKGNLFHQLHDYFILMFHGWSHDTKTA